MKMKPKGYRVLVKPDPVEKQTDSGIVLALNERKEKAAGTTGRVIGIGPTAWKSYDPGEDWEPWAKEGDHIVYSRYGGIWVNDPETHEEYILINDQDVLMVLGD